jgi:hypothetical protein
MTFRKCLEEKLGVKLEVTILPKVALALVVLCYSVLLMWAGLAGENFRLWDKWTKYELMISGIGFVIFASLPYAIATSVSIFKTQDKVFKLTHSKPVTVKSHTTTKVVTDFMARFSVADIFLGFRDPDLVDRLVEMLREKSKMYAVYINPGVLPLCIEKTLFSGNIYVIDCPRESCVVFGYDSDNILHCLTLRRAVKDRICWTAEIEPNSEFALYLKETFKSHYQQERLAVPLQTITMARCLNKAHRDRVNRNREICNLHIEFDSRRRGYEYATYLIKNARVSIKAVDFTPVADWSSDPVLRMYERAHSEATCIMIRRVHVFSEEDLESQKKEYIDFVVRQNQANVELWFLDKSHLRGIGIDDGFIIIDDEAVFISEEHQDRYEKERGRITFNNEIIDVYKKIFDMVEAQSPRRMKSENDLGNYTFRPKQETNGKNLDSLSRRGEVMRERH